MARNLGVGVSKIQRRAAECCTIREEEKSYQSGCYKLEGWQLASVHTTSN